MIRALPVALAVAFSPELVSGAPLEQSMIKKSSSDVALSGEKNWRCRYTSTKPLILTRRSGVFKSRKLSLARKDLSMKLRVLKQQLHGTRGKQRAQIKKQIVRTEATRRFVTACGKDQILDFTITTTAGGSPHVSSPTDRGAFLGLGYAHASQRLFQMIFMRLKMEGRLAEFLGPRFGSRSNALDLVALDRRYRTLGYARRAEVVFQRLSPELQRLLSAFAGGVNRFIAERGGNLPVAFERAGIDTIEPWKPSDAILVYIGFAHLFVGGGGEAGAEAQFLADVETFGQSAAIDRWLHPARDNEMAIHQVDDNAAVALDLSALGSHLPLSMKASHNWVVSGERTTTGKPVMVGLPMLPVESRFLFPASIESPSYKVRGVGFAGSPTFLLGFTAHTSWSVTALTADAVDHFKLTEVDPAHYLLDGTPTPYTVRNELIKVRNAPPSTLTVRESIFGPIMSEFEYNPRGHVLARRDLILYDAPDGRIDPVEGLLKLMRARTMEELRDSAWRVLYPAVHMLLASDEGTSGSIGYAAVIGMPVRAERIPLKGLLPIDGSTRQNDWVGLLAKDRVPFVRDPAAGFIVTANGLATNDKSLYGYGAIGLTDRGWRANTLLSALLASNSAVSPQSIKDLRFDCVNPILLGLLRLTDFLLDHHPETLTTPEKLKEIEEYLRAVPDLETDQPYAPLGVSILSVASTYFRQSPMSDVYGEAGGGLIHLLRKFELDPAEVEGTYLNDIGAYVSRVLLDGWSLTIRSPNETIKPGYGPDPSGWITHVRRTFRLPWATNFTLPRSLDAAFEIETGPLQCTHSGTLRAQLSNTYTQLTVPGRPDLNEVSFALGSSDDPASPFFESNRVGWEQSTVASSPLTEGDIRANCATCAPKTSIVVLER